MKAQPPTHLKNVPGEKHSLCGVKDPLPTLCAFAVPIHRIHYRLAICPECEALVPARPWCPTDLDENHQRLFDLYYERVA